MKTTTKKEYINIFCKPFCENYSGCDKSKIHRHNVSNKTACISCSAYKKKEANYESEKRGDMVL